MPHAALGSHQILTGQETRVESATHRRGGSLECQIAVHVLAAILNFPPHVTKPSPLGHRTADALAARDRGSLCHVGHFDLGFLFVSRRFAAMVGLGLCLDVLLFPFLTSSLASIFFCFSQSRNRSRWSSELYSFRLSNVPSMYVLL